MPNNGVSSAMMLPEKMMSQVNELSLACAPYVFCWADCSSVVNIKGGRGCRYT